MDVNTCCGTHLGSLAELHVRGLRLLYTYLSSAFTPEGAGVKACRAAILRKSLAELHVRGLQYACTSHPASMRRLRFGGAADAISADVPARAGRG